MDQNVIEIVARFDADIKGMAGKLDNLLGHVDKFAKGSRTKMQAFADGFNRVNQSLDRVGGQLMKWGTIIGGAYAAAGGLLTKLGASAVESENLFNVSLGKMAEAGKKWSSELADKLGLNEFQTRKNMSVLNMMLKGMGLDEEAAFEQTKKLTQTAYDMASAYDISFQEAFDKIRSGLAGQSEPLATLGINVLDENVQKYARENGIGTKKEKGGDVDEKRQKLINRQQDLMAQLQILDQKGAESSEKAAERRSKAEAKIRQIQDQKLRAGGKRILTPSEAAGFDARIEAARREAMGGGGGGAGDMAADARRAKMLRDLDDINAKIKDSATAQQAYTTELSESDKALARIGLIQDRMKKTGAAGDMDRTKDSPMNSAKRLVAMTTATLTKLSMAAMPGVAKFTEEVMPKVSAAFGQAAQFIAQHGEQIAKWAYDTLSRLGQQIGQFVGWVVQHKDTLINLATWLVMNLPKVAAGAVALGVALKGLSVVGGVVGSITQVVGAIAKLWGWIAGGSGAAVGGALVTGGVWAAAIGGIVAGFKALAETFGALAGGATDAGNFITRFIDSSLGPLGGWIDKYFDYVVKLFGFIANPGEGLDWLLSKLGFKGEGQPTDYAEAVIAGEAARKAQQGGAPGIPAMAGGGWARGGVTLVGERGPELVRLPGGSYVHTAAETRAMGGRGVNAPITVNFPGLRVGPGEMSAIAQGLSQQLRMRTI